MQYSVSVSHLYTTDLSIEPSLIFNVCCQHALLWLCDSKENLEDVIHSKQEAAHRSVVLGGETQDAASQSFLTGS